MSGVQLPDGYRLELLTKQHPRRGFDSGRKEVDQWFRANAWQHQKKHLSVTKVLLGPEGDVAGYYTLATGKVDFGNLPDSIAKKLPRRTLPVAVLAWLGVDQSHQGCGLGSRLLAQALRDCYEAGQTFAFVAVVLDCLDETTKAFYQQWDFAELPGNPNRLFLSAAALAAMMADG